MTEAKVGKNCELKIVMEEPDGKEGSATYQNFRLIKNSHYNYALSSRINGFKGKGVENSLYDNYFQSSDFATYDHVVQDFRQKCLDLYGSGWWFAPRCSGTNLNGPYQPIALSFGSNTTIPYGIYWDDFSTTLKSVKMMIRCSHDEQT